MARIILATFGSHGDLNPFLAVGAGLKARGHSVAVAAAPSYKADVERIGLEHAPLRPDLDASDLKTLERALNPRWGAEVIIRELLMPALRESYADLEKAAAGADLLVSHALTYAAPVLAEKKGLRWLSSSLQPLMFFSRYDPPVLAPAPWLAALRPLGPRVNGPLLRLLKRLSYSWGGPVRALRRDLGLGPGQDPIFEGQHSPYGTLALYSGLFARPQPDWPPRVTVCGFPFWDEDLGGRPPDPRLEAFLAAGEKPVVFTLGSTAVRVAGDFYRRAAEAARLMGRRAVLLAGDGVEALGPLPPGVFTAASAPYHLLFPRCAAIAHSGGVGTTAQALRSGAPQLIAPFAHDQFDNAARVARMGVGVQIGKRPTASKLAAALSRLLRDDGLKRRAARIGAAVRAENGVALACGAIEDALR
ncbi:MAG: glycosyltransferase family 1 protein [Elusimicrobia bacterium]|nr:glycosyltransferase family 1 protein [Elusimicrobiota bacterium]